MHSSIGRRGLVAALITLALSLAALPAVASAAAVPSFPAGSRPIFSATTNAAAARQHGVWLTVASKRKVDRNGELKTTLTPQDADDTERLIAAYFGS